MSTHKIKKFILVMKPSLRRMS